MKPDDKSFDGVVWIFDLDGTLWEENSHVCIVEQHLRWKKYTNFLSRIWCRLDFDSFMTSLNRDYTNITEEDIKKFNPHIVSKTNELLKAALERKDEIFIISSAPVEIIEKAKNIFGVPSYHAEIGKKKELCDTLNIKNKSLIVVTDNVSDLDLIRISDKTYFRLKKAKNKKKLIEHQDRIKFFH